MAGLQVVDIDIARENVTTGRTSSGMAIVGIFDPISQGYGQPWDITTYGIGKAILTTSYGYLLTLDLNVPEAPQLMNPFRPADYKATRVAVAVDYPYIAADNSSQTMDLAVTASVIGVAGKFHTLDVTDPYNPRIIGTAKDENGADILSYAIKIALNKETGLAFVTTYNSIQIYDIKDPYNPRLLNDIKQLPTEGGGMIPIGANYGIAEKDGWLYLSNAQQGLKVVQLVTRPIDIFPISPTEIDDSGKSMNDITITYRVNDKAFDRSLRMISFDL